jgi:predicted RNA binding protein YcfA (HicA-like mRNA interferase family)
MVTRTLRAVQRDGWRIARQSGSHAQLTHPTKPGRVTVAVHSGDIIPAKTLRKIIRQAGLTDHQFRDLL